jgi:hypothetical protein
MLLFKEDGGEIIGLYISIPLLYALTKLLDNNTSPFTCAAIYAVIKFILGLLFGTLISGESIVNLFFVCLLALVLAYLYFQLLNRFSGFIWWVIFIIGAFILFI